MSRELDAKVARVLGLEVLGGGWAYPDPEADYWHVQDRKWGGRSLQPVYLAHCVCELYADEEPDEWTPEKVLGHYPGCLEVVAHYSTDIAAARIMEDWIEEHRRKKRYVGALCNICQIPDEALYYDAINWITTYNGLWALIHATPEQRCRAFIKAMEVSDDE